MTHAHHDTHTSAGESRPGLIALATPTDPRPHADHHGDHHGGQQGDDHGGHGGHAAQFRDRFW